MSNYSRKHKIFQLLSLQPNESSHLGASKSSLFAGSSLAFNFDRSEKQSKDDSDKEKADKSRKLPIINPLVRLPSWPSKFSKVFKTKIVFTACGNFGKKKLFFY